MNPAVQDRAAQLRARFAGAAPFPHIVIDDFFLPGKSEQLLADFPPFHPENARSELGDVAGKATIPDNSRISPFYAEVYHYLSSEDFLDTISGITGIADLVHDEMMYGGGTHENLEGQELDPHVDFNYLEDRDLHRRLNLLLYLNHDWEVDWGGCLELHSNPRRPAENQVKVVPLAFNRCVIFETSERSWHGFERIRLPEGQKHLSRKLLSVYLYTRDRPAAEIAPPHGTFYVPRPLPPHLVAGHTLTEADARQLQFICKVRNGWMEYYAKKELSDASRHQNLKKYAADLLQGINVPLTGYALQRGPVRGIWQDGWVGREFEAGMHLLEPMRSLLVCGILPDASGQDVDLTFTLEGTYRETRSFLAGPFEWEIPATVREGETVRLGIRSSRTFSPARQGTGDDERELAFHLMEIRLRHR